MQPTLQAELLQMVEEDARLRSTDGPGLAAARARHAERLAAVLTEHGWPGISLVGEEGAWAAFLVVQHAIERPAFVRRAASLLQQAVARGEAPPVQFALLVDRMCYLEGRPQVFGTQYDWDAAGELNPFPIELPEQADDRRAKYGLPPLAEQTARMRAQAAKAGGQPPTDHGERQRAMDAWARSVGWRAP